jgi:hypothetical protein
MPVCESAGGSQRTLGLWTDGRENAECRWLRPVLVADFQFVEWTPENQPSAREFRCTPGLNAGSASPRKASKNS